MGAGASAAGMSLEERRKMYTELKSKYTRSDLDGLAEEEKQAWLEVVEDEKEVEAGAAAAAAAAGTAAAARLGMEAAAAEGGGGQEAAPEAKAVDDAGGVGATLSTTLPEVTVRRAAEAAAARTSASGGRKSGWDLSGKDNTGVRPQERKTRLSYLLADDTDDGNGGDEGNGSAAAVEGAQEGPHSARHSSSAGKSSSTTSSSRGSRSGKRVSAELPGWKKTAEAVETPNELCVGDIVRARDKDFNGMWFEGVLVAIHDETTFEVEISGSGEGEEEDGDGSQHITVGIGDLIRVMPWFCIEVGDMVECQPEGTMSWVRGTVVNIDLSQALYEVALESEEYEEDGANWEGGETEGGDGIPTGESTAEGEGKSAGERHFLVRVPDSRIRKIASSRQVAVRRWKKVYLASCLTGLGRYIRSKRMENENCAGC